MARIRAPLGLVTVLLLTLGTGCAENTGAYGATPSRPNLLQNLWTDSITPNADSSPAYIAHPRGRDAALLYVLAGNNSSNCSPSDPVSRSTLYALDAASGRIVWQRSTSGPSQCTTAGPVGDPSGNWVYAPGLDGTMRRYDAASGRESHRHGWPQKITLMPDVEKMSATATISRGYLYVTTSGFIGDAGHYQGHLVTVQFSSGHARVFNSLCSDIRTLLAPNAGRPNYCRYVMSGLFGRGQGVTDPVTGAVYIVSGNGPWNGRTNWGDSILKLDSSGNRLLDSYTPSDQKFLEGTDADLGSTGPAILPMVTSGNRAYHLLVQGGKGPACSHCGPVVLRLLNRDDLSGKGGPGHIGGDLYNAPTPGGCAVLTAPAVRRSSGAVWVYYANSCGTAGYRLSSPEVGKFRLDKVWSSGTGGTTPILSAGILYAARDKALTAFNATTGEVLWRGNVGSIHWQYPLVADGRLFLTDEDGKVYAYKIGLDSGK